MKDTKPAQTETAQAGSVQRLVSPLFVYLKSCSIEPEALKRIEDAGYVSIAVESFEDFRIIETLPIGATNEITKAALREIVSGYASAAESFGRKVAKTLAG